MSALQVVFLIIGAATLASAVMVVSSRKIMHAALWLILSLSGVAALFATLEAGFFTAIQVAVYIGAIAILILFAVMLTRRSMEDVGPQVNKNWPAALIAVALSLGGLVYLVAQYPKFHTVSAPLVEGENIAALGKALVAPDGYLVPFEVASVLLIAALIGAIYVSGEPRNRGGM
jgi:NADH-quinone oxidoreductase subunit J